MISAGTDGSSPDGRMRHNAFGGVRSPDRILLLGVGNTLLGDEGFGVAALSWLELRYAWPANVRLLDGGTRGILLMPDIMDCDFLLVLDVVLGPGKPGSFYLLDGDDIGQALSFRISMHQTSLADVLGLCQLAGHRPAAKVVGFEPFDWQTPSSSITAGAAELLPAFCARVIRELAALGAQPLQSPVGKFSSSNSSKPF